MTVECDVCGRVCKDRRGLGVHRRSHKTAKCPDCDFVGTELSIGPHRTVHGRRRPEVLALVEAAAAERRARTRGLDDPPTNGRHDLERKRADVFAQLGRLMPGASWEFIDRLVSFVLKHQPDPDVLLVATAEGGPWLCRPASVGPVIVREGDVAVVVAVRAVYRHVDERLAG